MTTDDPLVADFQAAHQETERQTRALAAARQRRRELAVRLYEAGCSYRWIGEQIGVTPQAVEGFIKYHQRRPGKEDQR